MAYYAPSYGYYYQPKQSLWSRIMGNGYTVDPATVSPPPDSITIDGINWSFSEPYRTDSTEPCVNDELATLGRGSHMRPGEYWSLPASDRRAWDRAIKKYDRWVANAIRYDKRRAKRNARYNAKRDRLERQMDDEDKRERRHGYKDYEKAWQKHNKQLSSLRLAGHEVPRLGRNVGVGFETEASAMGYAQAAGYYGLADVHAAYGGGYTMSAPFYALPPAARGGSGSYAALMW